MSDARLTGIDASAGLVSLDREQFRRLAKSVMAGGWSGRARRRGQWLGRIVVLILACGASTAAYLAYTTVPQHTWHRAFAELRSYLSIATRALEPVAGLPQQPAAKQPQPVRPPTSMTLAMQQLPPAIPPPAATTSSLEKLRSSAARGNSEAMTSLGVMLVKGTGVARDASQGLLLLRTAAEAGYVPAGQQLAEIYDSGDAVTRDHTQAAYFLMLHWTRSRAEQLISEFRQKADAGKWSLETLKEVQRRLKVDADGRIGSGTIRAAQEFAAARP